MSATATDPTIQEAKAEFNRAKDRMLKCLETTPDDKANWSPSPTSRNAIQQVGHAASSINGMKDWFTGAPFPFNSMQELDDACREEEKGFTSKDQVTALLNQNADAYCTWLDSLTPEFLDSELNTGFGSFPMRSAITWPADHIRGHAAQMEYLQTIWGDRDWHMGG